MVEIAPRIPEESVNGHPPGDTPEGLARRRLATGGGFAVD
jgi:hypothetical protein